MAARRNFGLSYRNVLFLVVAIWVVAKLFRGESGIPHLDNTSSLVQQSNERHSPSGKYSFGVVTFTTQENSYTHTSLKNKQHYAHKHGYDFIVDYEAPQRPNSSGIWWHKFAMLQRIIATNEHEWLWWIDFDSLVMNSTIALTDIVASALGEVSKPDDIDFIVAEDCNNLNAGSIIVRSTPSTLNFLAEVFAYGDANPKLSDQSCLRDLIEGRDLVAAYIRSPVKPDSNPEQEAAALARKTEERLADKVAAMAKPGVGVGDGRKSVLFVPQTWINAYPPEIACYDDAQESWREGMFAMHFPGAWAHIKDDDPYGVMVRRYEGQVIG